MNCLDMKLIFMIQQNLLCCPFHDQSTCLFYKNPIYKKLLPHYLGISFKKLIRNSFTKSKIFTKLQILYWFHFLCFRDVKSYYIVKVYCDNLQTAFFEEKIEKGLAEKINILLNAIFLHHFGM